MEDQQRFHTLSSHIQHYSPMDYHRFQSTYSMRPYGHPASTGYPSQNDCWFSPATHSLSSSTTSKYDTPLDYHSHPSYLNYNPQQNPTTDLDYKSNVANAATKATVAAYFNFNFNCDQAHNHHHHVFGENSPPLTTTTGTHGTTTSSSSPSSQLISPNNYKQTMHKAQTNNDYSLTTRLSPKASSSGGLSIGSSFLELDKNFIS